MLPDWPAGTVTILATAGENPRAIPVSAAVRAGPRHVLIALASGRRSLERLRADPRVSLAIIARDVAVTAHGRARVLDANDAPPAEGVAVERVAVERPAVERPAVERPAVERPAVEGIAVEGVVAVEIEVDDVQDHDMPTFAIESGVRWRWTDAVAERRDREVQDALARLALSRAAAAPTRPDRDRPGPRA